MFASNIATRLSPALRFCEDVLRNGLYPKLISRRLALVESCRRSLTTSSYQASTSIKKTQQKKDKKSRPRYAEDRKSTVDAVLDPEEAIGIVLRSSTVNDCQAIYRFLVAHAEWEGCKDLVKITEQDLIRDGFGDRPVFQCDVAEAHGVDGQSSLIGYGLYSFHFCAWEGRTALWENIFIHPVYRDLGIGSIFLHEVSKNMYSLGCRTIFGYFDENEVGLKRWYAAEGYESLTEKHNFHLYSQSGEKLRKYIHQDGQYDEYLEKASLRGIYIQSLISKNDDRI